MFGIHVRGLMFHNLKKKSTPFQLFSPPINDPQTLILIKFKDVSQCLKLDSWNLEHSLIFYNKAEKTYTIV